MAPKGFAPMNSFWLSISLLFMTFPTRSASPQDLLPPVLPWHGSSESLIASSGNPWITPAEKTGLTDTPNYEETIAYLKKLASASRLLSLQEFGHTGEGRTLYLVIASKANAFTPEALATSGKPAFLAQAGIHAGEIDGKDAGLMLLRDIAFGGKNSLIDRAHFLFVPVFNADGHERRSEWSRPNQRGPVHQGWRTTARNLNLNRDYMKADTPEMQAMLALIQKWSPSLYMDLHVTDGIDYQYDITFGYHGEPGVQAWSPKIGAWLHAFLRPAADTALRKAGHIPGPLIFARDDRDLLQGLALGPAMPRFSHGYGDLRHIPSILVENHSLKPYKQRVLGTYVLLEATLRALGEHAAALREAIASDQNSRPAQIPMNWIEGGEKGSIDFLGVDYEMYHSPASGGKEVRWMGKARIYPNLPIYFNKPVVNLARPIAYWVPVTRPEVISRLKRHGIQLRTLTHAETNRVTMYRLVNPEPERSERLHLFEGRHILKTGVKTEQRTEIFPAGSVRVSTDQPLGDLAIALLEPLCSDSLFAWGFFPEILQRTEYIEGYAIAPLAEQMLQNDPKLKAEFDTKLTSDPTFAASPDERLQWFYARTPFFDERYLLYPVGIEKASDRPPQSPAQ